MAGNFVQPLDQLMAVAAPHLDSAQALLDRYPHGFGLGLAGGAARRRTNS
jgi:hypothetical protein